MYILMKIMKTKQLLTMKNLQDDINANAMKMSKKKWCWFHSRHFVDQRTITHLINKAISGNSYNLIEVVQLLYTREPQVTL